MTNEARDWRPSASLARPAGTALEAMIMMNWTDYWASRTQVMKASMIRELLKLTARPEVISFAGGLPATETLPIDAITEACDRILRTKAATALQYGPT
ncbi:PLP-dependent aminotransferase family protein, partial [bacterium]|nr:PLP-dependent aminotransferase family protein [bacterium]